MKANLDWLREYVDIEESPDDLAHDLSMFGLNVEEVVQESAEFTGVVFGKVLEVKKHPNADKLSLCTVDAGGGRPFSIVCGAPNVRAGLSVAVALDGAVLPGGFKIKNTKIRGEVSEGMICSETELGVGEDSAGIMELDFETDPGTDLSSRLVDNQVVLDIEVTPNRPDQLSHYGIAREIAAMYRRELRQTDLMEMEAGGDFKLAIEDFDDCPRYSAALIEDVMIKESPEWLKRRLITVGVKPVSNIVDITNYVLMEIGHPLHAFDRDSLSEDAVFVRRAREGEKIRTLDGVERGLSETHLIITDTNNPIGVAGVMGGEDTEVTHKTSRILLESAVFNPTVIRKTRQELGLETEASYRFERGGDRGVTVTALKRACRLIEELGAGKVVKVYSDISEGEVEEFKCSIDVRCKKVNGIMGTNLSPDEIADNLKRLLLKPIIKDERLRVLVPTYRLDLREEIDIVEEVCRVHGYDNIKGDGTGLKNVFPKIDPIDKRNEKVADLMADRGFAEVITSSFMDSLDIKRFDWPERDVRSNPVEISNPLNSSQSVLRTSLLPGLLRVIAGNPASEVKGIRIFEIGKVFLPLESGDCLPKEELHLAAAFTRKAFPKNWIDSERDFDFFDMKGALETTLDRLVDLDSVKTERKEEEKPAYIFNIYEKKALVAEYGKMPARTASQYGIESDIFYFVIYLDNTGKELSQCSYSKPSPYPAVKRDLCIITDDRITFADISRVIRMNSKYLEEVSLFDYYRGGKLGENRKSYTFTMSFRSDKTTLKDVKVDKIIEKVLKALETELGATLRKE